MCNNRVYFGAQDGEKGRFVVLDARAMKKLYDCSLDGYENRVYIYMTINQKPGGIMMFEDFADRTKPEMTELFSPSGALSQYCISSVTAGSDGTLYYKNDSGCIFAVTESNPSVFVRMINTVLRFLLKLVSGGVR